MSAVFALFFLLVGAAWTGIWLVTMDSLRFLARIAAVAALVFFGLATLAAYKAAAQDHHPLHKDFYQHWKQPGSELSCCNARIEYGNGVEVGDCEPTDAKLIAGRWYARLPHDGAWIEVPDAKIIRQPNPTQGGVDAHLCYTPASGVLCFVPPFGGG